MMSAPTEVKDMAASARVLDSINRKRADDPLDAEEISGIIADFVAAAVLLLKCLAPSSSSFWKRLCATRNTSFGTVLLWA
jgi:hypothetical protein